MGEDREFGAIFYALALVVGAAAVYLTLTGGKILL